jgi:hypothetical protein
MRFVCIAALVLLVGCSPGQKAGPVSGTLLKGGKPYTYSIEGRPPGDPGVFVTLNALDASSKVVEAYGCKFDPSAGTFQAVGKKGQGIPAGKYRLSLRGGPGREDELGKEFSRDKSPLVFELSGDAAELTVDLDAKKVTVK